MVIILAGLKVFAGMGSLLTNNVIKLGTSSCSEIPFSILEQKSSQWKKRTKLEKIKLSFLHLNTISSFPKITLLYIFLCAKQRSYNKKLRDTCCLRRSFTSLSIWFICNMWLNNCLLKSPVETCTRIKQITENTVGSEILAIPAVIQSFQTLFHIVIQLNLSEILI